ncbi:acyl-CoA synthetase family member 4 [Oryzias latipes]|uniref:Aminoadipate-semialdehyde dehydrogenase n=1 Tax=Oryzias latipes TaxID=8090 RepID=H2L982_ORYLA|nr:acyl-CoA synthetase family member 4 [Oryzias latipes]
MAARTLQAAVSAAASLHADRTAVVFDSGGLAPGPPASLLYRELADLSAELSCVFLSRCSPVNGVIGLYCSDDLLVPVWILGILQCPAAYMPLDPEAPALLTAQAMSQSGLTFCAVNTHLMQRFQAALSRYLTFEVCETLPKFELTLIQIRKLSFAKPEPGTQQDSHQESGCAAPLSEGGAAHRELAYVLHTSGTTGPPKTVRVPHTCIVPNILHLRSLLQMSASDVVFLASPLTFDPSVVDIFLALSSGAQLLIVPSLIKKTPRRLAGLLFKDHKVTVLQVTPSLLLRFGHRTLKEEALSPGSSLRVLALGGEACPPPALLRSWKHQENKTCIFNLYGITEVSCWACCYKIPETLLQSSDPGEVPLGAPLMDTEVEVRDELGRVVTEGEGQLFLGGGDRVCLLDGESTVVPGTMRATGDWVKIRDQQLHYQGRKDRTIKRNGKRVNLDRLQQLLLGLPEVAACALGLHSSSRLLAFVVSAGAAERRCSSSAELDLLSSVRQQSEEVRGAGGDGKRRILEQLSVLLPSHGIPDTLELLPALPVTPHGKVDMVALMTLYERQREHLGFPRGEAHKLKQRLQALWKDALGLPGDADLDEQSNFLQSGGDSLKAVRLCEDIGDGVGASTPQLLEVLLDGTFSELWRHVALLLEGCPPTSLPAKKRHADPPSDAAAKRERKPAERRAVRVVQRAGRVTGMNVRTDTRETLGDGGRRGTQSHRAVKVELSLSWASDSGRCVDASPMLLVTDGVSERPDGCRTTVFIGSHSHRVQALDLGSGTLLWERVLGDRVEASAATSSCGTLVIVGCYDGCIYFLSADSGETRWTFRTGDAVKSCPAVDGVGGLVFAGSHDGNVYALDPQAQRCVWKRHCGGGGVFSSPHLHDSPRQLYVATLAGRLLSLNPDSGDELWSYHRGVPFFSSPNSSCSGVVIGSVDENICCVAHTGELLWQCPTQGPVFSSPCFIREQRKLLCGSHDGRLYCLSAADGSVVWTFQTPGRVYSSPCVFDGCGGGALVALASTDGTVWILEAENGQMLASHALPGELFSSPVVWAGCLVIGCRNDYVYALNLTYKEDA